jgi:hypothetical protein
MKYCLLLITPEERLTQLCKDIDMVSGLLTAAKRTWGSHLQYKLYELSLLEQSS